MRKVALCLNYLCLTFVVKEDLFKSHTHIYIGETKYRYINY
jgi:hypothetical protein